MHWQKMKAKPLAPSFKFEAKILAKVPLGFVKYNLTGCNQIFSLTQNNSLKYLYFFHFTNIL